MDYKTLLITTLGLAATATDAEITAALQNLKNDNANLAADNKLLKKEKEDAQAAAIDETIQLAIDGGKITAEQKPTFEALLKADFKNGKAALDAIKAATPEGTKPTNLAAKVNNSNPEAGKKIETVELKTISDWQKKDPAGLAKMKKEDKDGYIKLCADSGIDAEAIDWNA